MRFDYPVLVLINTNVINGHKNQVDSVRLILSKAAPHSAPKAAASDRGLLSRSELYLCPPPLTPVFPRDLLPALWRLFLLDN